MHVAITGASSGIGEALAREYAKAGAKVSLVARRRGLLEELARNLNTETSIHEVDLSKLETVTSWLEPAQERLGPIDILINNAGVQIVAKVDQSNADQGELLMKLNLLAPMRITRELLPAMLKRGSGTIVNMSSMAAFSLNPGMWYYNASKAGLAAASESLQMELKGTGVHVLTVYPGPVKTPMGEASFEIHGMKPGQVPTGDTETLARLVRCGVDRRKKHLVYPAIYGAGLWFPGVAKYVAARVRPEFLRR